jgi:uncharacterized repeat protein (TIGR04076 family)
MYGLKIKVMKVMGACTAHPPMKPGDHFTVRDGEIRIPEGGYICMWALQSLLPLIPPKEREISEKKDDDWMWRVRHAQCPDPDGRVLFEIERTGKIDKDTERSPDPIKDDEVDLGTSDPSLKTLRIEVDSVNGRCTSGMKPGYRFYLRGGRIYIPPGRHFCLYALQSVLPLLPAKQRVLQDGDWMKGADRIICPDPAGNVILRIDRME